MRRAQQQPANVSAEHVRQSDAVDLATPDVCAAVFISAASPCHAFHAFCARRRGVQWQQTVVAP